eukprot:5983206-Lingulodinium_polyedra.AAC.1
MGAGEDVGDREPGASTHGSLVASMAWRCDALPVDLAVVENAPVLVTCGPLAPSPCVAPDPVPALVL